MASKPPLLRTDIDGFLRAVGSELRAASEFLDRTDPLPLVAATEPRLLPPALPFRAAHTADRTHVYARSHGRGDAGATGAVEAPGSAQAQQLASAAAHEGGSSSPSGCSSSGSEDEDGAGGTGDGDVSGLMSLMLDGEAGPNIPPVVTASRDAAASGHARAPSGTKATEQLETPGKATMAQRDMGAGAAMERQGAHEWQHAKAARQQGAAGAAGVEQAPQQQHEHRQQSRTKVLTWLGSGSGGSRGAPCEPHINADAIPAVHAPWRSTAAPAAPAAVPARTAARAPAAGGQPWRPSSPPRPASAPLRLPQRPTSAGARPALRQSQPQPQPRPRRPQSYCEQLEQPAWQPRRLALARPPCRGCGREEAECCCASSADAPLRLLRPRHYPAGMPGTIRSLHRRLAAGCLGTDTGSSGGAAAPQHASTRRQPLAPVPAVLGPSQPQLQGPASGGAINIGNIQTAFFGGGPAGTADWQAAPPAHAPIGCGAAATAAAALPAPARWCGTSGCGSGAARPCGAGAAAGQGQGWALGEAQSPARSPAGHQMDVWAAYLASRRLPAGPADPASNKGSGTLGQLRTISQRIRGMQGDITAFLLQQHGGPAPAAAAAHQKQRQQQREQQQRGQQQREQGSRQARVPGTAMPPAACAGAAAMTGRQAGAAAHGRACDSSRGDAPLHPQAGAAVGHPADPFTDEAILTILTGTDFASRQQAALAAAHAAEAHAQGAASPAHAWRPHGEGGRSDQAVMHGGGQQSSKAKAKASAVQRLKEVQQAAVMAVRVGRQARAGQRSSPCSSG